MTLFHEQPYADVESRRRNGCNPAGRRPHVVTAAESVQPYRGRRISLEEMLSLMTPESLAIRAAQLAANDNEEASNDRDARAA